jgi:lipoate-protein ligase A
MKEQWRLLLTGVHTAAENMAIDHAILFAHSQKKVPPTVRFYSWYPPSISIGYFQSLQQEIDIEACKKYKIDYVRRITGGGAVFHDTEVTYSIIVDEHHPKLSTNIMESYQSICGAIIKGFDHLDVQSSYAPINDIVANNNKKKLSGNAQTRKYQTILQHGTILTNVDVEKMFTILKVPNEKIKDKLISDVKQRVTSLYHILGKQLDFDTVSSAMQKGFEEEFGVELIPGTLTNHEQELADKFEKECFSQESWNHKR